MTHETSIRSTYDVRRKGEAIGDVLKRLGSKSSREGEKTEAGAGLLPLPRKTRTKPNVVKLVAAGAGRPGGQSNHDSAWMFLLYHGTSKQREINILPILVVFWVVPGDVFDNLQLARQVHTQRKETPVPIVAAKLYRVIVACTNNST